MSKVIGKTIKAYRKKHKITIDVLAQALNVTPQYLENVEKGIIKKPSFSPIDLVKSIDIIEGEFEIVKEQKLGENKAD